MNWKDLFNVHKVAVNDKLEITVFEVKEFNSIVKEYLDENLITICEGKNSTSKIGVLKKRIIKLFEEKDEKWKMGAIAEFFIHLYINLIGYEQACIFLNLEENSIKKGFDGYYTLNNIPWIMESKSGSILTSGISHKLKLKEAIADLKEKVEGKTRNNPWQNAYSHACNCNVTATSEIRECIKQLADDYFLDSFHALEEFNIMPCATLFLNNDWKPKGKEDILNDANTAIENAKYKCAHLICVTQGSIEIFIKYINT